MEDGGPKRPGIFHPLLVVFASIAMLAWSWGTWPDPLVDYGTHLYVPWQLSLGKILYRDVAYFNGPLSPYFNALIFRIAVVGLHTMEAVNLLILAGVMVLVYRLTLRASGARAAVAGGITFALVFAFGQGVGIGNYNWVTPYAHEMTHGLALGLIAIAALDRFSRTRRIGWLITSGAAVGGAIPTKAELSAAAAAASIVQLLAMLWIARASARQIAREAAIFLASAMIVPLLAGLLLCLAMPVSSAFKGVLGSWPWVFDQRITSMAFYRGLIGLDDVPGNLVIMLEWTLAYAGILVAMILPALMLCRTRRFMSAGVFLLVGLIMAASFFHIDWNSMIAPLPIFIAVGLVMVGVGVLHRQGRRFELRLGLVVFSIVLLAKMLLRPHVYHYGFVLAMPATLVLVAVMAEEIPQWVDRRGGNGAIVLAASSAFWLAGIAACLYVDGQYFSRKQWWIQPETVDSFRGDPWGLEVQQLCLLINERLPVNATLAVYPQGLMVNYLTRRSASIPYINFMPPEVSSIGEGKFLDALISEPPEAIVLNNSAIEIDHFTLDRQYSYGKKTYEWIERNYEPIAVTHLAAPLPTPYGFVLLRHRVQ